MSREKLASARQSKNLAPEGWAVEIIGASAKAPMLGLLLSRGLDNGDSMALRRSAALLALELKRKHRIAHGYAIRAAQIVVGTLIQPLCGACGGRRYTEGQNAVKSICGACGGSGRIVYRDACKDRVIELATAAALSALRSVGETVRRGLERK